MRLCCSMKSGSSVIKRDRQQSLRVLSTSPLNALERSTVHSRHFMPFTLPVVNFVALPLSLSILNIPFRWVTPFFVQFISCSVRTPFLSYHPFRLGLGRLFAIDESPFSITDARSALSAKAMWLDEWSYPKTPMQSGKDDSKASIASSHCLIISSICQ